MSLYAQYFKEWLGRSVIENTQGFIIYRYSDKNTVYIENLYVIPEARKSYVAADLADKVILEAKERGCTECLGSVVPSAHNSTISMKVLLAYGFSIKSSSQDFILMTKDIA